MAQGKSQSVKAAAVEARKLARAARKAADKASAKAKVAADAAVAANQAAEEAAAAARSAGAIASPGARDAGTERWFPLEFNGKNWGVTVGGTRLTLEQLAAQGERVRVTVTLGDGQDNPKLKQQQDLLDFIRTQFATVIVQDGTCEK